MAFELPTLPFNLPSLPFKLPSLPFDLPGMGDEPAEASYLDQQLQEASFRGVPFHVDGAGVEVGRRVQVHEYPQRDMPWAEDLGRATRGFTVDAFVVGPNYVQDAQALIAAAEEEGPGTLVHPWLGSMQVSMKELMRVRFDAAAGHAVVTFSFVEPGELEFPSAAESTPSVSQMAADGLSAASIESFAADFSIAGLPSFVADLAGIDLSGALNFAGQLGSSFSMLSGWAGTIVNLAKGGVGGLLGGVLGGVVGGLLAFAGVTLNSLLTGPLALARGVMDLLDMSSVIADLFGGNNGITPSFGVSASIVVSGGSGINVSANVGGSSSGIAYTRTADPLTSMVLGIVRLAGNGGAGGVLNAPVAPPYATPARQQQISNTAAINALVRRGLLAQAVGISSHINTTVQTDAVAVRNELCAALDAESLIADDVCYQALQVARRAVWTDLTSRSSDGARLVALTPTEVLPALVLAYDRYEDAGRGDELAMRNDVIHPGFVPIRQLQVLSR